MSAGSQIGHRCNGLLVDLDGEASQREGLGNKGQMELGSASGAAGRQTLFPHDYHAAGP